jgi:hypothetical protein
MRHKGSEPGHQEIIAADRLHFGPFDPLGASDRLFGAAQYWRPGHVRATNVQRWPRSWLFTAYGSAGDVTDEIGLKPQRISWTRPGEVPDYVHPVSSDAIGVGTSGGLSRFVFASPVLDERAVIQLGHGLA